MKKIKFVEFEDILDIYEDSRNILWIATTSGIYRYSNGSLTFIQVKIILKVNPSYNIYEDQSNNIWLIHENSLPNFHNEKFNLL